MDRYSGAPSRGGSDWYSTLMQRLGQQQPMQRPAPAATDYNQMVSQALLGKKWEDLVPQPAKKEEPAAAPAPAPDKVAALEAQLAALQQAQQAAAAPVYDPGAYAAGRAHGGAIHGYAAGGSPSEDEILKLAFNIIRRKFQ